MRDAVHGVGVVRGEQHLPGLPRDVHRVVAANPVAILQRECRHTGDPVPEQRHSRPGDADLEQPRPGVPHGHQQPPGDAGAAVELTVAMGGEGLPHVRTHDRGLSLLIPGGEQEDVEFGLGQSLQRRHG